MFYTQEICFHSISFVRDIGFLADMHPQDQNQLTEILIDEFPVVVFVNVNGLWAV